MLVGKYDLTKYLPQVSVQDTTHLGILDTDNIYKFEDGQYEYYLIYRNMIQVFCLCAKQRNIHGVNYLEILGAQVYGDNTGNKFLERVLFFLKTHEHYPLLIGNTISSATKNIISKLEKTKRFSMSILDVDTNLKVPFSDIEFQKSISYESPTSKQIVLETSKPISPRYHDPNNILSAIVLFE